jgi:predicted nucleotide-binding protein
VKPGEVFVAYDTGTVVCQGKRRTELSEAVKDWKSGEVPSAFLVEGTTATTGPNKRIFIVYGHDIASREGLELVLHRMGLEPIVLANLPAAGDTIIEKLEHYLKEHGNVGFACALLTPDDEGYKSVTTKTNQDLTMHTMLSGGDNNCQVDPSDGQPSRNPVSSRSAYL